MLDHALEAPQGDGVVGLAPALHLVEVGQGDERLDEAGGLELHVAVDADQLLAGREVVDGPGGALIGGEAAVLAQVAHALLEQGLELAALAFLGLQVPLGFGRGGEHGGGAVGPRLLPGPGTHGRGGPEAAGQQEPGMGLGHQARAVGVAFAAVHHAPASLRKHDLEPCVDPRAQGGGHRVAMGLRLGRGLVPIIGDVVTRGALRQKRRGRGQQDEGRQEQTQ